MAELGSKGVLIVFYDRARQPAGAALAMSPQDVDRHLEAARYKIGLSDCTHELADVALIGERLGLPPRAGAEDILEALFSRCHS